MTIVIDTNIVLALYDTRDAGHELAVAFYRDLNEDVFTTPMAAAEMDHLVTQRAGRAAVQRLWQDFETGAIQVRWWSSAMTETLAMVRRRPRLALADASLLALAPVLRTDRIATLDRRDFQDARTADGHPFTLLP